PFGVAFGGNSGANTDAEWRMLGLGPRHSDTTSDTKAVTLGVKGKTGWSDWEYDLVGIYGRLDQTATIEGYLFSPLEASAFGASFRGAGGVPTCGTPAAPIPNCTPVNIFAVNDPTVSDPAAAAALAQIGTGYNTDHTYINREVDLD